ncbi:MAG: DUF433 domain-containing protein [Armatimonadota bacterium]|nr:DUF433 domain-containing protein [Armatimonadota bacterium]MDR5704160.1 DUF433 domain-containing protein [Armatimonadota bacterium]
MTDAKFPLIEFRASSLGRQPYIKGTGLAVWEVALVAKQLGMDARKVAEHLGWPEERVQAALRYAEVYPDEVWQRVGNERRERDTTPGNDRLHLAHEALRKGTQVKRCSPRHRHPPPLPSPP